MKLFFSPFSPYVRKVRLAAIHVGLHDRIELIDANLTPVAHDPAVSAQNPIGKIPVLVLDDGTALFDSRVIVDALDGMGTAPLLPREAGPARWRALRTQAIADGLLDAALLMRYEGLVRPADKQWPEWVDGQYAKVTGALDTLDAQCAAIAAGAPLEAIATACALAYLDLRFPDRDWRAGRTGLAAFYADYAKRPDMVLTAPRHP